MQKALQEKVKAANKTVRVRDAGLLGQKFVVCPLFMH